jgi:hypothetical protein
VTFDPFGDFESQGYLRNLAKEKDPDIVRRLEHASFMIGIDAALDRLAKINVQGCASAQCSPRRVSRVVENSHELDWLGHWDDALSSDHFSYLFLQILVYRGGNCLM